MFGLRKFILILLVISLMMCTLSVSAEPVGVLHKTGTAADGGFVYFVTMDLTGADVGKGSHLFVCFQTPALSEISLTQLGNDIDKTWRPYLISTDVADLTAFYKDNDGVIKRIVLDPGYNLSEAAVFICETLLDLGKCTVNKLTYMDNTKVLDPSISNEDGHIKYSDDGMIATMTYTYSITEETTYVTEDGKVNEYLTKYYNTVTYAPVYIALEISRETVTETEPVPTPTTTPTPTPAPTVTVIGSDIPIPSETVTPVYSPEPSETQEITIPDDEENVTVNRYENMWVYIALQVIVFAIVAFIALRKRL
jgi:hypothetical protein